MNKRITITVDGPVASGKSTVGGFLAQRIGFQFLDTGNIYRAVAFVVLALKIPLAELEEILKICDLLNSKEELEWAGEMLLSLKEIRSSSKLRSEEVGVMASKLAAVPQIRDRLIQIQRKVALRGGVVMVGRDIGTVIYPESSLKFYLEAPLQERAERRYLELLDRGEKPVLEKILAEMEERDRRDQEREVAPLVIPKGAVVIDTVGKSVDEVVELMLRYLEL